MRRKKVLLLIPATAVILVLMLVLAANIWVIALSDSKQEFKKPEMILSAEYLENISHMTGISDGVYTASYGYDPPAGRSNGTVEMSDNQLFSGALLKVSLYPRSLEY